MVVFMYFKHMKEKKLWQEQGLLRMRLQKKVSQIPPAMLEKKKETRKRRE